MKKRTLFSLLLGLVLCLTVMTVAASAEDIIIPEIRIECDVTSVTAGELPEFHASISTEHVAIVDNEVFNCWVRRYNGDFTWANYLDSCAENDGDRHYGLRFLVELDPGFALDESTVIVFNGVQRDNPFDRITTDSRHTVVVVDLGYASENGVPAYSAVFFRHGGRISEIQVLDGNKVSSFTPTREGYYFDGWYADSSYTTLFDFTKPIHSNEYIYAKWRAKPFVPELNITCDITTPVAGLLPAFQVSTTTEHVTIQPYGSSNTVWTRYSDSQWKGFGDDEKIAVKDGSTHYGLLLCVNTDDGLSLNESTKIILNGVERNDVQNEITLLSWGGYVRIDLGLAVDYGGAGWYMNEDDGILHLNGSVTNPSTMGVDQSPWQEYKSKIKASFANPVHPLTAA